MYVSEKSPRVKSSFCNGELRRILSCVHNESTAQLSAYTNVENICRDTVCLSKNRKNVMN